MSQKPKFSRDVVIELAFETARESGFEKISARKIAKKLNSTVSPIFTLFKNMDELKEEVINKGWLLVKDYLKEADLYTPSFKMRGYQLVKFAKEEPNLFKMLMMQKGKEDSFFAVFPLLSEFNSDLEDLSNEYDISITEAKEMFKQLAIIAFGICSFIINNGYDFTDEEIFNALGKGFLGNLSILKNHVYSFDIKPVKKNDSISIKKEIE